MLPASSSTTVRSPRSVTPRSRRSRTSTTPRSKRRTSRSRRSSPCARPTRRTTARNSSGSKTTETNLAVLTFRYGNPTLKTLSSKNTWDDVVAALKADKEAKEFVKTKEECDKRALLKKPAEWLARFLLRVTQSETFGIEPKTDKIG